MKTLLILTVLIATEGCGASRFVGRAMQGMGQGLQASSQRQHRQTNYTSTRDSLNGTYTSQQDGKNCTSIPDALTGSYTTYCY